jgi:DNA (cytosine-5)-methyltransferase 1
LCSGFGGLDIAAEIAFSAKTKWMAEVNGDALAVLSKRFPEVEQLGDVTTFDWLDLAGEVDILTAGYPCQPFSLLGERKGVEDERNLWPHVSGAISKIRPKIVVLENVRGHVTNGFTRVLADFATMGMSLRWGVVRASDAGAPHSRERLFIVGSDPNRCSEKEVREALDKKRPPDPPSREDLAGRCGGPGCSEYNWGEWEHLIRRWEAILGRPAPEPSVQGPKVRQVNSLFVEWMMGLEAGWVTDVLPNLKALRILGNGVVPQQAVLAIENLI